MPMVTMYDPEVPEEVLDEKRNWEVPASVRWDAFMAEINRAKNLWTDRCESCKGKKFDVVALGSDRRKDGREMDSRRKMIWQAREREREAALWRETARLREIERQKQEATEKKERKAKKSKRKKKKKKRKERGGSKRKGSTEENNTNERQGRKKKKKKGRESDSDVKEDSPKEANESGKEKANENGKAKERNENENEDEDESEKGENAVLGSASEQEKNAKKEREEENRGEEVKGRGRRKTEEQSSRFIHRNSDEWTDSDIEEQNEKTPRKKPTWLGNRRKRWPYPKVIIVEGFLLYCCPGATALFDKKLFLTVTREACRTRRYVISFFSFHIYYIYL